MKSILSFVLTAFAFTTAFAMMSPAWAGEPNENFIVRTSSKSPAETVAAIEAYAKSKKWVYLGANKVKKGSVTLVKICIRSAGKVLWKAGLHVSAMVPCGNLGVYKQGGETRISLLHPRFLYMIYPDPNVKKAVDISAPLLILMMNELGE